MKLSTFRAMAPQLGPLLETTRMARSTYRTAFLAAAAECGLLARLAGGPADLAAIAAALDVRAEDAPALEAWLDAGVRLGELARGAGGFRLRGRLARRLAEERHDAVAALLLEVSTLHHALLLDVPRRLRERRPFTLADQDGALIARSSRVLEPVVAEAVAEVIPARGPVRLLEIGCGSGVHLRAAAARNPEVTGLGVELQAEVAGGARANLAAWGLADRFTVEAGDVRDRAPEPRFDVVTLHNNVYYFAVDARPRLFAHLRGFLAPGGRLLATTGCQGGGAAMAVLDLWSAATVGCGRLPDPAELVAQLGAAGFVDARARRLVPGESYYAFVGTNPG